MFCNQNRSSPCIVVKGNKVNMDFTFLWATSSLTLLTIKLVFQNNWKEFMELTTPENTITYHNALCLSPQKFCISIFFSFSWELKWPQEKLKTMLMQNFGVTNKEHYDVLCYFLEWSIGMRRSHRSRACSFWQIMNAADACYLYQQNAHEQVKNHFI